MESVSSSKEALPKASSRRKRKRRTSETNHSKSHAPKHPYQPPPHKRARAIVSTTAGANNIMKFRLGGSVSDPLNLEDDHVMSGDPEPCGGQPSPLPPAMAKDPLNLDDRRQHSRRDGEVGRSGRHRRKSRRRTVSKSHDASHDKDEEAKRKQELQEQKKKKAAQFRYGNYDRYYGYRNQGASEKDPRLSLFRKEWFENKDCLDIGCNTGQVTIALARDFNARRVVGLDIDGKLVATARKNIHRSTQPLVAPDGRRFPVSLTQAHSSLPLSLGAALEEGGGASSGYPDNIEFKQGNYVPSSEEELARQSCDEFDVILALSLTKWVHLNWGDAGVRLLFKRVYQHLRPGGLFILEPQAFASYARKKRLTPEIAEMYGSLSLRPDQFHALLMGSEVGFTHHEFLGVPANRSKGFQRPLHLYTKAATSSANTELPSSRHHPQPVAVPTASHTHSVFEQPIQVPLPEGMAPIISDSLLSSSRGHSDVHTTPKD